jgi:hypothetical protein
MGTTYSANLTIRVAEGVLEKGLREKPLLKVQSSPGKLGVVDLSTQKNLHLRMATSPQSLGPMTTRTVDPNVHSFAIQDPDQVFGAHLRAVLKQEISSIVHSLQGTKQFAEFLCRSSNLGMSTPASIVNALAAAIDSHVSPQLLTRKASYYSQCQDGTPVLNVVGQIRPEHVAAARRSVQGLNAAVTASALMTALSVDSRTKFIIDDLAASSGADAAMERTVIILIFVAVFATVAVGFLHSSHIYDHHRFAQKLLNP